MKRRLALALWHLLAWWHGASVLHLQDHSGIVTTVRAHGLTIRFTTGLCPVPPTLAWWPYLLGILRQFRYQHGKALKKLREAAAQSRDLPA